VKQGRHIAVLMTVAAALLWASSFSVIKAGLRHIGPYSFLFFRFLIATALLAAATFAAGKAGLLVRYLADRYAVILGLALAASFSLQFRAQTEIPASSAAIIINSSTLLVAPLSFLFLREPIGSRKIIALLTGIAGVYLIAGLPTGIEAGAPARIGNLLISGSALATALYVVITKKAVSEKNLEQLPLLASIFIWSMPVYLFAALPSLKSGFRAGPEAWLAIVYLAVFCSALAFLLWVTAIRKIGALTSAIVLLSELVFGVIIARIFLRETISPSAIVGCILIALGILIIALGAKKLKNRGQA
jgi:drug/metabolite transporter (DMT)-like permease